VPHRDLAGREMAVSPAGRHPTSWVDAEPPSLLHLATESQGPGIGCRFRAPLKGTRGLRVTRAYLWRILSIMEPAGQREGGAPTSTTSAARPSEIGKADANPWFVWVLVVAPEYTPGV
jgi:hypothetical protein